MHLQLGRGSNPGVIRAEEQPRGEDDALRGFFAATRRGAVETLAFQARARGSDLLWEPVAVAREVLAVVDRVRPDAVIVDHLAFSARLALASAASPTPTSCSGTRRRSLWRARCTGARRRFPLPSA